MEKGSIHWKDIQLYTYAHLKAYKLKNGILQEDIILGEI